MIRSFFYHEPMQKNNNLSNQESCNVKAILKRQTANKSCACDVPAGTCVIMLLQCHDITDVLLCLYLAPGFGTWCAYCLVLIDCEVQCKRGGYTPPVSIWYQYDKLSRESHNSHEILITSTSCYTFDLFVFVVIRPYKTTKSPVYISLYNCNYVLMCQLNVT